jgi:hypothetical protein
VVPSGRVEDLFLFLQVPFFVVMSPRTGYDLLLLVDCSNGYIYFQYVDMLLMYMLGVAL